MSDALRVFFRPTLFKVAVALGLVPAALLLHLLTLSPFEGSAREGVVSAPTSFIRAVGRRVIFTGVYRDLRRSMDLYFQPTGAWEPDIGFADNPTWGARVWRKYLPETSWTLPGKVVGWILGLLYAYGLACIVARLRAGRRGAL